MPRQTRSFLERRFAEVGIRPRTRHGQNFLIDLNLLDVLLEAARLDEHDVVLEVGTGTGSLTARMAERAAHVVSVEVDPQMHRLAREELIDAENVTLLQLDALSGKNRLNPAVLNAVGERLAEGADRRLKLCANLPYNIAAPLVSNLLALADPPQTMTVTIQKELAERIIAPPGTKDYSALSVWVQSQCRAEIVRTLPPQAFWPRPKVTSAIIHIELDAQRRARLADREQFHHFVRDLFCHRRKFLRGMLVAMGKDRWTKPLVDELMAALGLGENARAEALDVETLIRLADAVAKLAR